MQKSVLVVLTLSIVLQSAIAYDYLLFVQEPAGNICLLKDCTPTYEGQASSTLINMHGLWPNNADGSYPATCTSEQYDESQIDSSVLQQLNANWVGLYSSSQTFRAHEWTKHGTCYEAQQGQYQKSFLQSKATKQNDFFSTVMQLKQKFDLTQAVYSDSLLNGNVYTQSTAQLRSSIASVLGVNGFALKCGTYQSKQILTEIWFCLDLNLNPINCSNETDTCKGSQINAYPLGSNFKATN